MVQTAYRNVRTAPVRTETSRVWTTLPKFKNFSKLLFKHGNSCPSERCLDARAKDFDSNLI